MREQKNAYNNWKCSICNGIFRTRALLKKHRIEVHEIERVHYIIDENGKRKLIGKIWNKGKTKENDERVKKQSETLSDGYKSGRLIHPNLGTHHTEEEKRHLSEVRKAYLKENPDKVPYLLNHHSKGDSYPEKYFKDIFDKYNIKYEQNYYKLGYFLDFAWPDKKMYLEIDGEQHYLDKRIVEHDKIRTNNLLNEGWICVDRIRWSEYQKMSLEEKEKYLESILTKLN